MTEEKETITSMLRKVFDQVQAETPEQHREEAKRRALALGVKPGTFSAQYSKWKKRRAEQ